MKTLHIIKNIKDDFAHDLIKALREGEESSILLMQDAVYVESLPGLNKVFACEEDAGARQIENRYPKVSFDEIARMVTEYDRTIVW
ncbi:MAG: hypothetical protein ACYDBV_10275 [Nitrospiria bacterium]